MYSIATLIYWLDAAFTVAQCRDEAIKERDRLLARQNGGAADGDSANGQTSVFGPNQWEAAVRVLMEKQRHKDIISPTAVVFPGWTIGCVIHSVGANMTGATLYGFGTVFRMWGSKAATLAQFETHVEHVRALIAVLQV